MEGENEGLSSEEKAYFDSRGETEIKVEPTVEKSEPETVTDEVETEVETGAEAETDGEQQPDKPQQPKTVPLAALTKEREARKAEKARIAELERLNNTWQERWNQVLQPQKQEQAPAEPEIPAPEDPMGRINWIVDQIQSRRCAEN